MPSGGDGNGGGILNTGAAVTLTSVAVSGNTAAGADPGEGRGGIFNNRGTLTLTGSSITGNQAAIGEGNGGGVLDSDGGTLSITGGEISANQAARAGVKRGHDY